MSIFSKILISFLIGIAVIAGGLKLAHTQTYPIATSVTESTSSLATLPSSSFVSNVSIITPAETTLAQLALRTNADWKNILTPAQYSILREQGTETPFTSDLLHETRKGTFVTADCGEPVFRSETKFDSGTGWPSFYASIKGAVVIKSDTSFGITREEVETPVCHSHLGHLFHDAPQTPTSDRYCINGVALRFIPDATQ